MTTFALPEGRPGRLLALALVLLAVLVLWTAIVSPLLDLYATRAQQLDDSGIRARHMAAIAAQAPGLRRQLAARHGAKPVATDLVKGGSDALALATLQGTVQSLAGATGIEIASVDTLPAAPVGGLRRIGLHLHATGDYPTLVRFLGRIRDARPAVLADDLTISAQGPDAASRFDIDVSLYAFRSNS
ncbi:MAG TPA: type II secretion system protein GspM [Stellaceae bacterium]|nr:type II secretion system protein GspM [Stellaceae bacterium]